MLKYVIIFAVLLVLFYLYPKNHESIFESPAFESFKNFSENKFDLTQDCPNILVRDGERIELLNTRQPRVPGINPVYFDNLEDYAEYIAWAQRVGIKCPILYYEQTYDTQNNRGFRMLDDPLNPNAGLASNPSYMQTPTTLLLDSNRDDPPYNQNNFAAFDPNDQDVGNNTPLDNVTLKTDYGSLSAMDDDWCGGKCSQ